jgi:16S rRNA (guanine(1405)-N(7))-methyltransferase
MSPVAQDSAALSRQISAEVESSRKYRGIHIPEETIQNLVNEEFARRGSVKEVEKAVREKLHHIVAPYLGDPDYNSAAAELAQLAPGDSAALQAFCLRMLALHASTRERIPVLESLYPQLWAITGQPRSIMDVACAMHPFSLPWMGLAAETRYQAFDLHQPRVNLLNQYFRSAGLKAQAFHQDILIQPPQIPAHVGLFFKEAHRFEQRQHGCNRAFWQALPVEWLLVSLPAENLTGTHSMRDRQRRLVDQTLAGLDWPVTEIQIQQEIFFCIQKL